MYKCIDETSSQTNEAANIRGKSEGQDDEMRIERDGKIAIKSLIILLGHRILNKANNNHLELKIEVSRNKLGFLEKPCF